MRLASAAIAPHMPRMATINEHCSVHLLPLLPEGRRGLALALTLAAALLFSWPAPAAR
jgi:hypothetical protein